MKRFNPSSSYLQVFLEVVMHFAGRDSMRTSPRVHRAKHWPASVYARMPAEFCAWITLAIITLVVDAYILEGYDFGSKLKQALVISAGKRISKFEQNLHT